MTTVGDIVGFLAEQIDLDMEWHGKDQQLDMLIHSIRTDVEALPGDLSWISSKQATIRKNAIDAFHGSLLIGPKGMNPNSRPFISCNRPKLALILTVDHFFFENMKITWPETGKTISQDARIGSNVSLAPGVIIGSQVVVDDNVVVGPNTVIANTHIHKNVRIGANCTLGLEGFGYDADEDGKYWRFPHTGIIEIHEDVEIGSNVCIDRGSIGNTILNQGVKIDNLVHIAHNVRIGDNTLVIANTMLGGSVNIGRDGWIAPSTSIMNQVTIGKSSVIGLGSVVLKDVDDHSVMVGNPAKLLRRNQP